MWVLTYLLTFPLHSSCKDEYKLGTFCRTTGTGLLPPRQTPGSMSWRGRPSTARGKRFCYTNAVTSVQFEPHPHSKTRPVPASKVLNACLLPRPLELTGRTLRCLNLGSYNYLGFAAQDEYCTPRVLDSLASYGWATSSSRTEAGADW